jgi:hypothetical protein
LHDGHDRPKGFGIQSPNPGQGAPSVDRSQEFTLHVARLVQAVVERWFDLDVQSDSPPGCRERRDDKEWEAIIEYVTWAKDEC